MKIDGLNQSREVVSRAVAYESPIGCIGIVAADPESLSHVFFADDFLFADPSPIQDRYPVLIRAEALLRCYFAGESIDLSEVPIRPTSGTDFQSEVWAVVHRIPYGELRSYRWIAEQIGKPKAVRAVGSAVGANVAVILNPCHRVIRSDGGLGGYGGGLERKRRLLALEGHPMHKLEC